MAFLIFPEIVNLKPQYDIYIEGECITFHFWNVLSYLYI